MYYLAGPLPRGRLALSSDVAVDVTGRKLLVNGVYLYDKQKNTKVNVHVVLTETVLVLNIRMLHLQYRLETTHHYRLLEILLKLCLVLKSAFKCSVRYLL